MGRSSNNNSSSGKNDAIGTTVANRRRTSGYRLLPDVALADIAFEASADSIPGLFEACARGLTDVMVDRRTLRRSVTREIEMNAEDLDGLLYDFLTQLIIMKDVDSLLFRDFSISVNASSLKCVMRGETIERDRQTLRNDVKAVTMHMFGIRKNDNAHESKGWQVTVVLDI